MKKVYMIMILSLLILVGCSSKEYKSDLESVVDDMKDSASEIEPMLDRYTLVWKYSIEHGTALDIDDMSVKTGLAKDVIKDNFEINNMGNVTGDFSSNINSLNSVYENAGNLSDTEDYIDKIKNKISDLNNPPKDFEKVYDEVLNMYTSMEKYAEMATDPSGSLQSYAENKNDLTDKISSEYKKIKAMMPD